MKIVLNLNPSRVNISVRAKLVTVNQPVLLRFGLSGALAYWSISAVDKNTNQYQNWTSSLFKIWSGLYVKLNLKYFFQLGVTVLISASSCLKQIWFVTVFSEQFL